MPTVLNVDGFQVRILMPPREHGPAHVHVRKAGTVVVINLPEGDQPLGIRTIKKMRDAEILAQLPAARAREARERKQGLRAVTAKYDRSARRIVLELTNGYLFAFPVRSVPALKAATGSQLAAVEIDPSGGALRWEDLDVDLSVPGLLFSAVGVEERLRHLASLAGRVSTDAKARAARSNGLKGGRPKKRVVSVRTAKTPSHPAPIAASTKSRPRSS